MHVPLVDLRESHRALMGDMLQGIESVIEDSAFIAGPAVERFERAFAAAIGVSHAIGVASGTDALALAARALGIGPGDEVITVANTWISTALAISYAGARPVFVDVDAATLQMDVAAVRRAISARTRAVFAVHLFGHPAPVHELAPLCRDLGIALVEDVAQAPQATIDGRNVGTFGDIGCYSFYPTKNLGCLGDGGAVVTNRDDIAGMVRRLACYGQSRPNYHEDIGFNSRLDTLQAAVLLAKLPLLSGWTQRRRERAERYRTRLAGSAAIPLAEAAWARAVYHLFVVQMPQRDACMAYLKDRGVTTKVHYPTLVPFQPCYHGLGYRPGDFPVAERAADRLLSLPFFPELSDAQQDYVVEALECFFADGDRQ